MLLLNLALLLLNFTNLIFGYLELMFNNISECLLVLQHRFDFIALNHFLQGLMENSQIFSVDRLCESNMVSLRDHYLNVSLLQLMVVGPHATFYLVKFFHHFIVNFCDLTLFLLKLSFS